MFSLGLLRLVQSFTRFDPLLDRASPLVLTSLIIFVIAHGIMLIQLSNGGSDLVSADIPKSLMLLQRQNPYSVNRWASPYPPLLLLVDSGIIQTASLLNPQSSIDAISQNIRTAGLLANATVAILIYRYLRRKTASPLTPLISAGLFLTLPALSISPLYFFHSDTFGYPILGLVNNILPEQLQITPNTLLANQAWIAVTLAPYTIIIRTVWTRGRRLNTTDIILLGLVAWLIPLKIEYTHYAAWAIIPVLMRGRIKQTIPVLGLLQLGDSLSYWTLWPNTSPLPGLDSFYGLLTASIVYRTLGIVALGFVLYSLREKTHSAPPVAVDGEPSQLFVEGYC